MRLALICPYDLGVPGGVQAHVLGLAAGLRQRGDVVTTVGPGGAGLADHRPVGRAVAVPINRSVAPIALGPGTIGAVTRTLRSLAPDVVHVHEPVVPWVSLVASRRAPAPVVGTFHAWSEHDRLYRAVRPLVAGTVRGLTARVAVSQAAADYHAAALGISVGSFTIVPNGIDTRRFATAVARAEHADDPRPHLLFLGRLEPRKGLAELLRAFALLKTTRPDARLLVAGAGPEQQRCEALLPPRLRSDIAFLGYVAEDEKARLLASCDVFVAPNVGGESFGIVLAEAMAAGRPVVASDLPGFRSVVADGVTGRLVPPGDAPALAAALAALLDNPSLRRAMGRQGAEAARAYDWAIVVDRLRAIYRAATQARGTPPAASGPPLSSNP